MFDWLRRRATTPPAPMAEPLPPMQEYAKEFAAAWEWSVQQGLRAPPVQLMVRQDCVDWTRAEQALQRFIGPYRDEEIATQALAINDALLPVLSAACGIPFQLTLGWYELSGKSSYKHGPELPERLLKEGIAEIIADGLPMHIWLTSPAFEIIDVSLPTQLAKPLEDTNLLRQILYYSSETTKLSVIYHPTVVGDDFLVRIGAALPIGAR